MENSKKNYVRFNRQEVFTSEDRTLVMKMIFTLEDNPNLENMLFGLFDGYYYNDLEDKLMDSNLPVSMLIDITELLDRVSLKSFKPNWS